MNRLLKAGFSWSKLYFLALCCVVMCEQRLALWNNLCWLNLLNFTVLNTNKECDIYCANSSTLDTHSVMTESVSVSIIRFVTVQNTHWDPNTLWSCRNGCYTCQHTSCVNIYTNILLKHTSDKHCMCLSVCLSAHTSECVCVYMW